MSSLIVSMRDILGRIPVMPILTIHDASQAGDLGKALVDGGLPVFEVLMRTPAALSAIEQIAMACPSACIGAGTLLRDTDVSRARNAGAAFGVSPGLTAGLAAAACSSGLPLLPGVSSASEIMNALDFGFTAQKYFPAYGPAGVAFLKMMGPVFPQVTFCPTGGITKPDLEEYLSLPNCNTVGCSWIAPVDLISNHDWKAITRLANEASRISGGAA